MGTLEICKFNPNGIYSGRREGFTVVYAISNNFTQSDSLYFLPFHLEYFLRDRWGCQTLSFQLYQLCSARRETVYQLYCPIPRPVKFTHQKDNGTASLNSLSGKSNYVFVTCLEDDEEPLFVAVLSDNYSGRFDSVYFSKISDLYRWLDSRSCLANLLVIYVPFEQENNPKGNEKLLEICDIQLTLVLNQSTLFKRNARCNPTFKIQNSTGTKTSFFIYCSYSNSSNDSHFPLYHVTIHKTKKDPLMAMLATLSATFVFGNQFIFMPDETIAYISTFNLLPFGVRVLINCMLNHLVYNSL